MGTNPVDDITEGLERIRQMFPEDYVQETKSHKNPMEAMKAAGVNMGEVQKAVGGRLDNILHVEQVGEASWKLKVRRITPSGNYTETITVAASPSVLSENADSSSNKMDGVYRLTLEEVVQEAASILGDNLLKVEALQGGRRLLALHVRENHHDTKAVHRVFSELNSSLHAGGWHATMSENTRWTLSPAAGSFLEKRVALRSADNAAHLYPPQYYLGRSTEAGLRSTEIKDDKPQVSEAKKEKKEGFPTNLKEVLEAIKDGSIDGVFLLRDNDLSFWFLPGPFARSKRGYSGSDLGELTRKSGHAIGIGNASGWYGDMSPETIEVAKAILAWLGEDKPEYPGEFVDAQDIIKSRKNTNESRDYDDDVHALFSQRASNINNSGMDAQIKFLKDHGVSIPKHAKTSEDLDELVHDLCGELAAKINNAGTKAQKQALKEDVVAESDARKRAFRAGYPMTPHHALAQSTDTIMYPSIGNNDKVRDEKGQVDDKDPNPKQADNKVSMLNKAVNAKGEFL